MSNFTGNTHRAVIETSVPPRMELIAAGPLEFCQTQLAEWISKHPLPEFGTGLVVEVTNPEREAFIAKAIADPEGQRLATAAANLATTWGKEWATETFSENDGEVLDRDIWPTEEAARHVAKRYSDRLVSRVVSPWTEPRK